ncbi:hypothetical protein O3M35_005180 [Rhynocoris fuscipes]|uniref:Uncharacterized protein n=1 Tax=Rhynocoris fuscipes TaxID=488301 RepID=A0AAW1DPF9_9HEMI
MNESMKAQLLSLNLAYKTLLKEARQLHLFTTSPSPKDYLDNNKLARTFVDNFFDTITEKYSTFQGGNTNNHSLIVNIDNGNYVIPPLCNFFSCEIHEINNKLQENKYDFILLDPPWKNKFIRRKKIKNVKKSYYMLPNNVIEELPINKYLNELGLLAVWCTNSPTHLEAIKQFFNKWNLEYVAEWFWIKVTQTGEPVCNVAGKGDKKPYERLIFGAVKTRNLHNPERGKVIISVPSAVHSHKPPLSEVLSAYLPENPKCLELFARYLLPGWTRDGGNEHFFDQLSSNTSAMMTSMVESKSSQDLFTSDNTTTSVTTKLESLQLDSQKVEPVVCKIFSQESPQDTKQSDKSFFDIISSNDLKTSDIDFKSPSLSDTLNVFDNNEGPYPSPLQGFEDVCDALYGADSDRTRESWIPSEKTRRALILAATSSQTSYTPDKDNLTMPGLTMEEEMVDGVTLLVKQLFGEAEANQRKVLTANDVSQDERGLRELIQAECYRAAVNLTGRLLTIFGQGFGRQGQPTRHSPHSIQLWFTRFCLLVKLGAVQIVESEAAVWWDLDKPDLYYQFYPELYGGKLGTMVPFQMRILLATLPSYLKQYTEAFERLYSVLAIVNKILSNLESGKSEDGSLIELSAKERDIAKQVWSSREARVQHAIINVALMSKNYILAIEIFQNLIEKNKSINQKRALQSALGRVFLQMGDIINAERCFSMAKQLKRNKPGTLNSNTADIRELVDKGLMLVSENKFEDAYECFQKASLLEPTNIMVLNNMAVCLLYTGKLKDALKLLSSTISSQPSLSLQEPVLLNICTLFELGSSHMTQKEDLLRQVAKYRGDSFNVACLKLSTKLTN